MAGWAQQKGLMGTDTSGMEGFWGKTAAVGGTLQNRDSSLWVQTALLVQVWLCLQQLVLWLVAELCWSPQLLVPLVWAGLGTQQGRAGGVGEWEVTHWELWWGPQSHLHLFIWGAVAGSTALNCSICLLHQFVPLHKKGNLASITHSGTEGIAGRLYPPLSQAVPHCLFSSSHQAGRVHAKVPDCAVAKL